MLLVFVLAVGEASANTGTKNKKKTQPRQTKSQKTLPVESTARYADIVIDAVSGRVIHAKSASSLRHPASLTKMMTLYLTFQALESGALRPDQRLSVSVHAAAQSPSKVGLKAGETIRVRDAIMSVVTCSANDASVVLAEALGGSESRFADMMNRQARALGMRQTVFKNASGLPNPDQVSTARDMAMLSHALIYHYPQYYDMFSSETFAYAGRVMNNHNHLMKRYEGMDGIKTGYVRASGFNLAASAVRGDTRLIAVVFGGKSRIARDNQVAQLLDRSFAEMKADHGFAQNPALGQEAQGDSSDAAENLYVALPSKVAAIFGPPAQELQKQEHLKASVQHASVASGAGGWGIQVGAFSDAESGQQALRAMSREMHTLLSRTEAVVQKTRSDSGDDVYRARFVGMELATARSVCAFLVKKGQGCFVVAAEAGDVY